MNSTQRNTQGEGNRQADREFRESEKRFVNSEEGKRKIAQAGNVSEEEARKLREAEEKGKARAKAEDPAVRSGSGGSGGPGARSKP